MQYILVTLSLMQKLPTSTAQRVRVHLRFSYAHFSRSDTHIFTFSYFDSHVSQSHNLSLSYIVSYSGVWGRAGTDVSSTSLCYIPLETPYDILTVFAYYTYTVLLYGIHALCYFAYKYMQSHINICRDTQIHANTHKYIQILMPYLLTILTCGIHTISSCAHKSKQIRTNKNMYAAVHINACT